MLVASLCSPQQQRMKADDVPWKEKHTKTNFNFFSDELKLWISGQKSSLNMRGPTNCEQREQRASCRGSPVTQGYSC